MGSQVGLQMTRNLKLPVKGVLLDITGVLYESGSTKAIDGSISAIDRLRKMGMPIRFVTNESQKPKQFLVEKLKSFGYTLGEEEVISPAPAVAKYLIEENLRPHLLVNPDVLPEFSDCDQSSPNCVVLGDCGEDFSYHNLNKAFQILIDLEKPIVISMGGGMYYKEGDQLVLDVGAFAALFQYANKTTPRIIGKPSAEFFQIALNELGIKAEEAVLVGDDINSDVGGAQNCGMQGVLVRTGKYRPCNEKDPKVTPDAIFDNLSQFVDYLASEKNTE